MKKAFGWMATMVVGAAVLAVPATARERDDYHYYQGYGYHAVAPRHESAGERLERERRERLERDRFEHRGWDRDWR